MRGLDRLTRLGVCYFVLVLFGLYGIDKDTLIQALAAISIVLIGRRFKPVVGVILAWFAALVQLGVFVVRVLIALSN